VPVPVSVTAPGESRNSVAGTNCYRYRYVFSGRFRADPGSSSEKIHTGTGNETDQKTISQNFTIVEMVQNDTALLVMTSVVDPNSFFSNSDPEIFFSD
jgi:hypothetical protein